MPFCWIASPDSPDSTGFPRIFPDLPVTSKPTEVRMGKGKGSVDFWSAKVKPGRVMFEIDGVSDDVAREALRLAAMKLPIKSRVVVREDW